MGSGKLKKIFKGEFPNKPVSLDDQVKLVTSAGELLKERVAEGKSIDEKANNLFLWLGGQDKDVQLYACKHIFNYCGLEFDADEKVEARLAYMEPHFKYDRADGYIATTFQSIDHRPWPVEYLDGTTFEDRLEELAKEVREEMDCSIVTVDMVLSGTAPQVELSLDQSYGLISACGLELKERSKDANSTLYYEQFNRLLGWLMLQQPEIALVGLRSLLTIWQLPVQNRKALPNLQTFVDTYGHLVAG